MNYSEWLFGKKSKEFDEEALYYTSVATQRVQHVIQFKRGYKHLFFSKLALLDCCINYDVVTFILSKMIEMTNSVYTKEYSRVGTLGERIEDGDGGMSRDGDLETAIFVHPFGVYIDHTGHLFVLDGHSIRLVGLNSEKKIVRTIAGNYIQGITDGPGADARFMLPVFMTQDPQGDYLVLESHAHQIRKISCDQEGLWNVSTCYKFERDEKDLSYPHWIGYNRDLEFLCSDTVHNDVLFIDMKKRKRMPLIKQNSSNPFYYPAGCCFNSAGDLFICDYHHHCIKKVPYQKKGDSLPEPQIFAGFSMLPGFVDGGKEAQFLNPNGVVLDVDEYLLVVDAGNNAIRRISPSGIVTTIAGKKSEGVIVGSYMDGKGKDACFSTPTNLVIDGQGNLIVADWKNNALRIISF